MTVRLWEVGSGAELRRMEGFSADAYAPNDPGRAYSRLAFSPDGRLLARGGPRTAFDEGRKGRLVLHHAGGHLQEDDRSGKHRDRWRPGAQEQGHRGKDRADGHNHRCAEAIHPAADESRRKPAHEK